MERLWGLDTITSEALISAFVDLRFLSRTRDNADVRASNDERIAPDGEVLVQGPSVTVGYWKAPEDTHAAFEGGWFHTGDIGSFDESGRLLIRGRKKDVIVTAEGLHVFPEDVERVLLNVAGGITDHRRSAPHDR